MLIDKWGTKHLWYCSKDASTGIYSTFVARRTATGGVEEVFLGTLGGDFSIAVAPNGRIVMSLKRSDGMALRTWNGKEWSQFFTFPPLANLTVSADGRIFLSDWREDGKIVIQEILVEELTR